MQEWLNRLQDIDWNFVQVSALGFLMGCLIALVIRIAISLVSIKLFRLAATSYD
jgi:hypothetical protein